MSIYKSKNNWKAEVWIDNKRMTGRAGFVSKMEAKSWHDQTLREYQTNPDQFVKTKKVLFDELLEKFQEIHLPSVSIMTRLRYQVDIDQRIRPFFQYRPVESITPMLVESFRAGTMKTDLSYKSINHCVNLLYCMFRKGEEWGMVDRNPVKIRALKIPEQKYAWWEKKEDIIQFLEAAEKTPYYLAFRIALECGLRLGEVVGLSKGDISLERCQLHIHRQWIEKEMAYGPTKGRRERFVPFHPESGLKELLKAAIEKSPHPEAIIVTPAGTRVLNRKLSGYHFNKLVRLSQVPKIRFHDLRHTFASWYMIEVGDIWSLKGILGHVDVQTTQRYAHLSQRHQKMPALSWSLEKNKISHAPATLQAN